MGFFAASRTRPAAGRTGLSSSTVRRDWRAHAKHLEENKRLVDAAKLHEAHKSYTEAARLFEASGDSRNALRSALTAKDQVLARRILVSVPPSFAQPILEKAAAYELLMDYLLTRGEFAGIAKLYERARQFDQAALAWEKAGKFSAARKAFDRAHDSINSIRVREIELQSLKEKGDLLGAATVLIGEGDREGAVKALLELAPVKAYRFLQKLKLEDEAKALLDRELTKAEMENKPADRARWLELRGDLPSAAQAWLDADRKDRALNIFEQLEMWPRAALLAEDLERWSQSGNLYLKAGDAASAERMAKAASQSLEVPLVVSPAPDVVVSLAGPQVEPA